MEDVVEHQVIAVFVFCLHKNNSNKFSQSYAWTVSSKHILTASSTHDSPCFPQAGDDACGQFSQLGIYPPLHVE